MYWGQVKTTQYHQCILFMFAFGPYLKYHTVVGHSDILKADGKIVLGIKSTICLNVYISLFSDNMQMNGNFSKTMIYK